MIMIVKTTSYVRLLQIILRHRLVNINSEDYKRTNALYNIRSFSLAVSITLLSILFAQSLSVLMSCPFGSYFLLDMFAAQRFCTSSIHVHGYRMYL